MGIGREIVETLQITDDWLTVNELKNSLLKQYSSKQVGTEIRRIKEWSVLGNEWIMKSKKIVQNMRKNGEMGKVRFLNCYKMKDEAKHSHIEVLLTMTRGVAFNHHGQKVEARTKILVNTRKTVDKLSSTLLKSPVISSMIKNDAFTVSRRIDKVTNLKTPNCY